MFKPIIKEFRDDRGKIQILDDNFIRIETFANKIRASHYHKKFGHWCVVVSGNIEYYERKTGSNSKPFITIYKSGSVFYTPKMYDHLMKFNVNTLFYCWSDGKRDQKSYCRDTFKLNYDLTKI